MSQRQKSTTGRWRRAVVFWFFLGIGARLFAFEVALTVDATAPGRPVNSNLVGNNMPWPGGNAGTPASGNGMTLFANRQIQPEFFRRLKSIGKVPMRYPGGDWADSYDWRMGIGPAAARRRFSYHAAAHESSVASDYVNFGTLEFLDYCRRIECIPVLQVNMHQLSAKQAADDAETIAANAADWVRYVNIQNGSPTGAPNVEYWELGNEPYLKRKADWGYLSPSDFANRVVLVMKKMLQQDRRIKFLIPFATDTWSGKDYCVSPGANNECNIGAVVGDQLGYSTTLLRIIQQNSLCSRVHALALHYYMPLIGTSPPPSDVALYWATMAGTNTVWKNIVAVKKIWKQAVSPSCRNSADQEYVPKLAITEFNSLYTTDKEMLQTNYSASQAGAMYVADAIRLMAELDDVEMATNWSASANGQFGAISFKNDGRDFPVYVRPHYFALLFASELLQPNGNYLPLVYEKNPAGNAHVEIIGKSHGFPAMPLTTALATVQVAQKKIRILLLNKDVGSVADVKLALKGATALAARIRRVEPRPGAPFEVLESSPAIFDSGSHVIIQNGSGQSVLWWNMPPTSFALVEIDIS